VRHEQVFVGPEDMGSTAGRVSGSFRVEASLGIRVEVLTTGVMCDWAVRTEEFSRTNEVRGRTLEEVA
jgi:hypothetical protein